MSQKLVHNGGDSSTRTSFDVACMILLKLLAENQRSYSITGLANETKLHRKTVEKCINLLETIENKWLEYYRLKSQNVDKKRIVALERRNGLLSYPDEVQKLILRVNHFPRPSEEVYTLLHLYLKEATIPEKALSINGKDEIIKKLLKQGQIKKADKEALYLSEEGIIVAKGALKIFPDLEKHKYLK